MRKTSKTEQAEREGRFGKGHGTGALGPSDTSDSGSDIQGGPGLSQDDLAIGLDTGTTSDPDRRPRRTAGPHVGDPIWTATRMRRAPANMQPPDAITHGKRRQTSQ